MFARISPTPFRLSLLGWRPPAGVFLLTGTKPKAAPSPATPHPTSPPWKGQAYHEEGEGQPNQEEHGPHERPADHVGSRPRRLVEQLRGQDPCHSSWDRGEGQGTAIQGSLPCLPPTSPPTWEWGSLSVLPEPGRGGGGARRQHSIHTHPSFTRHPRSFSQSQSPHLLQPTHRDQCQS